MSDERRHSAITGAAVLGTVLFANAMLLPPSCVALIVLDLFLAVLCWALVLKGGRG